MKLKLYFNNGLEGEKNFGTQINTESSGEHIIELLEILIKKIKESK